MFMLGANLNFWRVSCGVTRGLYILGSEESSRVGRREMLMAKLDRSYSLS